jgi:hypothetical protein
MGRDSEGGVQLTTAGFTSPVRMMGCIDDFNINSIREDLGQTLDRFTNRGSGYTLLCITKFIVSTSRYNPLGGPSYIPTPPALVNRKAIVNVCNNDNECFKWAVLSALYPANDHNGDRVAKYKPFVNNLDFSTLRFPVTLPQIRQFERVNEQLKINVYVHHNCDIVPVYLSKHAIRSINQINQ